MENTQNPFDGLHEDSDMLHRYEVAEWAWWSDPEVRAALNLLKRKQLEYVERAGMNAQSQEDQDQFREDLWEHTRETDQEDIHAYTAIWYNGQIEE